MMLEYNSHFHLDVFLFAGTNFIAVFILFTVVQSSLQLEKKIRTAFRSYKL